MRAIFANVFRALSLRGNLIIHAMICWKRPSALAVLLCAVCIGLSSCLVVPLEPTIPPVERIDEFDGPVAKLLVAVNRGSDCDDKNPRGFSVFVDGKKHGWIPNCGSYIQLRIPPGTHHVVVSQPWRHIGIIFGIPLPESGEFRADATVSCAPLHQCGASFTPVIDQKDGLVLVPQVLTDEEMLSLIRELKAVEEK